MDSIGRETEQKGLSKMSYNDHYKELFTDAVQELAGSQNRSLLKELVGHEAKQGEVVYLDGIAPDDEANDTAFTSTSTRERYEEMEAPDFDDYMDLQTPHMNVEKQRTLCVPRCIDWGHHFNKEQEIAEIADPKSRTLRMGMKRVWKREDALVLSALGAASVTRGRNSGNTSSVNFPSGQKLTVDAAGSSEKVDKDLFGQVMELFEAQFTSGERIFLVMSPRSKRELIEQSGDKILSSDFVTARGYLERGELPDIYGVHVIVHPALQPVSAGVDEYMYAWTPEGITWNQFSPLTNDIGKSPEQRFHWIAYMEEYAGCVRVDDNRVVQITIDNTSGS